MPDEQVSGQPLLEVRHLCKSYGSNRVVEDVSFSVQPGETLVIMGPSGCGKSTTIRCLNRLTEPDSGEIYLLGQPVHALDHRRLLQVRQKMGFVFQHFNLIERLTVLENVMLGLVMAGMPRNRAREEALQALQQVGLEAMAYRRPASLSGGQRQRVGIARALAGQPALMLWDEPTASLDPIMVQEVLSVMERLIQESRSTMIIVTHEVLFALRAADQVLLMDRGRVVECGPPREVFLRPRSLVGRRYQELIQGQLEEITRLRLLSSGAGPAEAGGVGR